MALGVAWATLGCTAVLTYPVATSENCFDHVDDDFDGHADFDDPDCALVGAPCTSDATCAPASLVCAPSGAGEPTCVPPCAVDSTCPVAGWSCGASGACTCAPCVERCNTVDDDCDGRVDEATCAIGEVCTAGACHCAGRTVSVPSTLDLLFVIDDSHSMTQRLTTLKAALPSAVRALSTGDLDGDGVEDVAPVASLHIGVVTTDLGNGLGMGGLPGCDFAGDDGILSAGTHCPTQPIFYFETYRDDPAQLATDVTCALTMDPTGCGFSEPLDAALLAISPSSPTAWTASGYTPRSFHDGTSGHGSDGANARFLRPSSTLAIVVVTDSDDCSAIDTGLYSSDDPAYSSVGGNLRCFTFEDALEPVSTFVRQLFALRRLPQNVFFAAITGIPRGAGAMTPDAILALPAMQIAVDPSTPERVLPACTYTVPGSTQQSQADPARRLVEVAREVECSGGGQAIASICDDSYDAAFREILRAVARADDRRVCVTDAP